MTAEFARGADRSPGPITLDRLLVHLREAGARRVYLPKAEAFRDGSLPVVATYEYDDGDAPGRAALVDVFESVGDRVRFQDREWDLAWTVDPAYESLRADHVALYDRGVERRCGDGFNLRGAWFAYEQYRDLSDA